MTTELTKTQTFSMNGAQFILKAKFTKECNKQHHKADWDAFYSQLEPQLRQKTVDNYERCFPDYTTDFAIVKERGNKLRDMLVRYFIPDIAEWVSKTKHKEETVDRIVKRMEENVS